ncbi:peptidoglycan DD-metalloendopeptidase family protein [[Clostridium] symbiosum]|uniref:murein hydrolase activator EnvC family protein n=1 Tax=Clostridium symbiosum TaxID=1512 RepID=UPI001923F1A3|nr:M23 family metallopeptidase [[Clostridium] symbiosum]MDB2033502.1 peptidoglycan DD-metalloendopeptidase family protein [[Clostridium] symbiosum]
MRHNAAVKRTVLAILLASLAAAPAYGASKKDVDSAKGKISSIEEEKKKTEQAIKELETLKADTETYVRKLDSQLETLNVEVNRLEGNIRDKEKTIEETAVKLDEAGKVEKKQYEAMKKRIKYMYEKGDSSYLDILLQSKSMSELLNRAEYISKISEYDRNMLDQYAAVKDGIADDKAWLEKEKAELVVLQEQTTSKKNSVETLVNEKSAELKKVNSQIGTKTAQVEAYEKDIKAQEDKIKQIEAEIKRQEEEARKKAEAAGQKYNTVSIGNIKFIWPCPSSSRITSGFGGRESPTEGASSNHQGIDIGAPTGSNIVAAADGTVTISTYSYSAGNYIMLNHGGGVSTVYMHCSQLLVSAGDTVKQGQVIAKVGSTGYSTGPHLHFGVRLNGSYVNPAKYVSP